jgi:hypothetical protein
VVPGRLPEGACCLRHPPMGEHADHREQAQSSAGVVRRMAISDHCLCVSNPRCLRISWKVTSNCQRITNQQTIFLGSAPRSVQRRAWALNAPWGSRISTQRTGTAGKPVEYHTALAQAISTVRSPLPYQLAILVIFQTVLGSSATTERLGKRSPFMRGLPIWPWRRGGAGS